MSQLMEFKTIHASLQLISVQTKLQLIFNIQGLKSHMFKALFLMQQPITNNNIIIRVVQQTDCNTLIYGFNYLINSKIHCRSHTTHTQRKNIIVRTVLLTVEKSTLLFTNNNNNNYIIICHIRVHKKNFNILKPDHQLCSFSTKPFIFFHLFIQTRIQTLVLYN